MRFSVMALIVLAPLLAACDGSLANGMSREQWDAKYCQDNVPPEQYGRCLGVMAAQRSRRDPG